MRVTVALAGLLVAACGTSTPRAAKQPAIYLSAYAVYALRADTGTVTWRLPVSTYEPPPPYSVPSAPAVSAGRVFVSSGGVLIAANATNGVPIWRTSLGPFASRPAVVGGTVYVGTGVHNNAPPAGAVVAVRAADGAVLWRFPIADSVVAAPAAVDGVVYAGAYDGSVYALHTGDGSLLWRFATGHGFLLSSPVVAGATVYIAEPACVYALDAARGTVTWSYCFTSPAAGALEAPAVTAAAIVVGSADGTVYALRRTDGTLLWRFQTAGPVYSGPAVGAGLVYVGSRDQTVYALDATRGTVRWRYVCAGYPGASTVFANTVYVGVIVPPSDPLPHLPNTGQMLALDAVTGVARWTVNLPHPANDPLVVM